VHAIESHVHIANVYRGASLAIAAFACADPDPPIAFGDVCNRFHFWNVSMFRRFGEIPKSQTFWIS